MKDQVSCLLKIYGIFKHIEHNNQTLFLKNCVTKPCNVWHTPFHCSAVIKKSKFKGNRSEQLYPVQPLLSSATVSAKVPFNESL